MIHGSIHFAWNTTDQYPFSSIPWLQDSLRKLSLFENTVIQMAHSSSIGEGIEYEGNRTSTCSLFCYECCDAYRNNGWSIDCSIVCSREYLSKEYDNINRNSTKRTQADTHTPRASPEKQIDLMIGTGEDPWIITSSSCVRWFHRL